MPVRVAKLFSHESRRAGRYLASALLIASLWPATSVAQSTEGTLAAIANTKTITIGYREDAPPFSYRLSDGKVIGYSIDLCRRIAESVRQHLKLDKLEVALVPSTAATRFVLVKSGKVDLECTTTTNTAERREQVAFSYPHFMTATRFVSRKSDGLTGIKDLSGRSVVSTTGTINVEQLNALNRRENLNISVLLARQHADAFAMVEKGRASAFVMDGILLAALVASSKDPAAFAISEDTFGPPEPYGILMRKDDSAFKEVVNGALREVFVGGEINEIYEKWFMSPIPPDNRNLNLPISPTMQAAFESPHEYLE
jgi:glutamate/aspartate transport system substrate-binding protein